MEEEKKVVETPHLPCKNIANNICELIGNTPMVYLNKISKFRGCQAKIALKLEGYNPMLSVKDRIALSMIDKAEKEGRITPGKSIIIEPTSGNTGIGIAMVAAYRGYKTIIVMPQNVSLERRKILKALNATIHITPAFKGMTGTVEFAKSLLENTPDSFMPQQFENEANPQIHYETTAREIWQQTNGQLAAFISGVGTGGTLTGCARFFKEMGASVHVVAVEPAESAILSGALPGRHGIQGIGAGFIPQVMDVTLLNESVAVKTEDAYIMGVWLAREEGLLLGISSAAAVVAAIEVGKREEFKDKLIVAISPSFGERYLSSPMWDEITSRE